MPQYRVTYCGSPPSGPASPDTASPDTASLYDAAPATHSELLEADRVDVEAGAWIVLRRTVHVVGRPREVVVRRIAASSVAEVEEVAGG